jgi:hypothetical protein
MLTALTLPQIAIGLYVARPVFVEDQLRNREHQPQSA